MQPSLLDLQPRFDGPDVTPTDQTRLTRHLERVKALMADGSWRTLSEIACAVGASEAGVSARLRDLRKLKWGSHTVERRRVLDNHGQHEYRLVLSHV